MTELSQQEFLRTAKEALGLEWDQLAEKAGIHSRALKTYRLPSNSKNYRAMPSLAKDAIERLVQAHNKRMKKAFKGKPAELPKGFFWYLPSSGEAVVVEKRDGEKFIRFTNGSRQDWVRDGEKIIGPLLAPI